jgi:acyl-CoA synthetase (AMP-forming)/AMP-acid ligase II
MNAGGAGPAPNRICELAKIDIPIIQAPMTYIAGAQLAAAVSNAGALGIIETTSEQGRADLRRVRDLTDGSVGANIALIMNRDPATVDLLVANNIRFVTVIGVSDPKWGGTPMAVIVARDPNDPPTDHDIETHCRADLAPCKRPRRVVVVDALPRNASRKVLKTDLRREYAP